MDVKRKKVTLLVDQRVVKELKSQRENLSKIAEEAFRARLEEIKARKRPSRDCNGGMTEGIDLSKKAKSDPNDTQMGGSSLAWLGHELAKLATRVRIPPAAPLFSHTHLF